MPSINILREFDIERTSRVMQVEGIFDMKAENKSRERWHVDFELPDEWNVGLIVGPSGSGKTTIINELWGGSIVERWAWSGTQSILDGFPSEMSVKDVTQLLSSVGFSSPPNWLRPYGILSNGEKFRVDIARTLAECPDLAIVDEFTSVVDRTVAKIGSAAVQKTVRKRNQKFIASSCHYDVIDWLEPDWVYKPDTGEYYTGRYLHQRPTIDLEIKRVHHDAWNVFRKYHYLDTRINKSANCFVALWNDIPVAFAAVIFFPHPRSPAWVFHRVVCLPDYQGVGIGVSLATFIASVFSATGRTVRMQSSQPSIIYPYKKSKEWKMVRNASRVGLTVGKKGMKAFNKTLSSKRLTTSFKYVGEPASKEVAEGLLMKAID